jgi:alkylhydroperoxidase/carboxymuconolactone decarboxylase family protein YurZ
MSANIIATVSSSIKERLMNGATEEELAETVFLAAILQMGALHAICRHVRTVAKT